jgi:hypothetical protein
MASPTFRKLDKDALLKMLSDLALSAKQKPPAAASEQSEKKAQIEPDLKAPESQK